MNENNSPSIKSITMNIPKTSAKEILEVTCLALKLRIRLPPKIYEKKEIKKKSIPFLTILVQIQHHSAPFCLGRTEVHLPRKT